MTAGSSVAAGAAGIRCFHCGEPVPPGPEINVRISGRNAPMCCHGCQSVAQTIVDYGLERFYERRSGQNRRQDEPRGEAQAWFAVLDRPPVERQFVVTDELGTATASLILEDLVCPACCWLIETRLGKVDGIESISVNFSNHRAAVRWNAARITLSRILEQIARLGYSAYPAGDDPAFALWEMQRRAQLRRIAIAGLFGMQVMMVSVALYFGTAYGIEVRYRNFLSWVGLLLALPVIVYSAHPFFEHAWRDVRLAAPGMDVPIALAILIAFAESVRSTVSGGGTVYYDTITMFVFLLLVGRFVEFSVRRRSALEVEKTLQGAPATAIRVRQETDSGASEEVVPTAVLEAGDVVLVRPGSVIPSDGRIVSGAGLINEAMITGESAPVRKNASAEVVGGSVNLESPLRVIITRTGADTLLSHVRRLVNQGQQERTALTDLANRISSWFILAVLAWAGGVAWYWLSRGDPDWLAITISVLVVACPCALALATPAAVAAATGAMLRSGLAVVGANALESLSRAEWFVFDKTGTLTRGELSLTEVNPSRPSDRERCLRIAAALEQSSEHPIAKAVCAAVGSQPAPTAGKIRNFPGQGLCGTVEGRHYVIGTSEFIGRMTAHTFPEVEPPGDSGAVGTRFMLADNDAVLCEFRLADGLRPEAKALICRLHTLGRKTAILSGDADAAVQRVHKELGTDLARGRLSPEAKRDHIRKLMNSGAVVAAVGDGINDAPVLAAAHVSVAMGAGTDLAKTSADAVLLSGHLATLASAVALAIRARRIIRQNVAWAIAYNVLALPAAGAGFVTPWMAAIGMSLSSLLVVGNSARLAWHGET